LPCASNEFALFQSFRQLKGYGTTADGTQFGEIRSYPRAVAGRAYAHCVQDVAANCFDSSRVYSGQDALIENTPKMKSMSVFKVVDGKWAAHTTTDISITELKITDRSALEAYLADFKR
jgi:hypothetical protein